MSAQALTIGCFDGVHQGHRFLLQQLRALAEERGMQTLALTFRRHPAAVLGKTVPPQLCTLEEKERLLKEQVREVKILDFTEEMARLTAKEFMKKLRDEYGVGLLLLGYDHRFGRPSPDDDYERDGHALGIEVLRAKPLPGISSSAIRQALQQGRITEANEMLGRPYTLSGTVVKGRQVGRSIGFPTANLSTPLLVPKTGVYTATTPYGPALVNIGHRPTLNNGSDISIEAHIIGYEGDLYGQSLSVSLLRRLRDEQTFPSLEALRRQIENDLKSLTPHHQ